MTELESFVTCSYGVVTLGPLKLHELYQRYGSAKKLAQSSQLKPFVALIKPKRIIDWAASSGIEIITLEDPRYPALLKEITDPPLTLYWKGELPKPRTELFAIVGTRKPTDYGKKTAELFAQALARQGIWIVSGLAYGIDAVAHRSALSAKGKTIAVVPGGLDDLYPSEHRSLAADIVNQGAVMSEFPPETRSYKSNFGIRNRIIAGLARGTLVVEAADRSGTLLTARSTLEYNRELFAIPHSIFSAMGYAPNHLIKMGAHLVTEPADIINEFGIAAAPAQRSAGDTEVLHYSAEQAALLQLIATEPRHIDELVALSGLPIQTVQSTLVLLEIDGLVRHLGASRYVRA